MSTDSVTCTGAKCRFNTCMRVRESVAAPSFPTMNWPEVKEGIERFVAANPQAIPSLATLALKFVDASADASEAQLYASDFIHFSFSFVHFAAVIHLFLLIGNDTF